MFGKRLALAILALLLPLSAAAQSPERGIVFVEALRANGCAITPPEMASALGESGLSEAELSVYADMLEQSSLALFSRSGFVLSQRLCVAPAEQVQTYVTAAYILHQGFDYSALATARMLVSDLRRMGCVANENWIAGFLGAHGVADTDQPRFVAQLTDAGIASAAEGFVGLEDAYCQAEPEAVIAMLRDALPPNR